MSRCYPCHDVGGIGYSTQNLTSYKAIAQADIIGQVGECMMPPPDAGQPTIEERTVLFDWEYCGKPNN